MKFVTCKAIGSDGNTKNDIMLANVAAITVAWYEHDNGKSTEFELNDYDVYRCYCEGKTIAKLKDCIVEY